MRQITTKHWSRITKAKAKKMYMAGDGPLLIVPCKVDPENRWGIGGSYAPIHNQFEESTEEEWEKFLNEYCWYNCQYAELGKYPAFYERRHD